MPRKPEQRIDDIIRSCEKILRFTTGMAREGLFQQELVMDAVLRNLEIIGEATKNLPDDVRARIPGVEWKEIAGMRDWISHVYYRVGTGKGVKGTGKQTGKGVKLEKGSGADTGMASCHGKIGS